jgi:hypothetical protein
MFWIGSSRVQDLPLLRLFFRGCDRASPSGRQLPSVPRAAGCVQNPAQPPRDAVRRRPATRPEAPDHALPSIARRREPATAFFGGEPVPQAYTDFLHAFDPSDTRGQIRAQEPAVGGFIGQAADGSQSKVNRPLSEMSGLKMNSISEDDGPAERKPRLRAVPFHEFVDGVPVTTLGLSRS